MYGLKPPVWVCVLLCVGAVLFAAVSNYRLKAKHAEYVAASESAARQLSERYREKEQELARAQAENAAEVAALHHDLDRARTSAAAQSVRLRDAAKRARCPDPATAGLREATDDPIGVLADVLGRADERASILADLADRRGIAGRACERAYDEARQALEQP